MPLGGTPKENPGVQEDMPSTETEWAYRLGEIGYEAYGDAADWKNYEGKPMPRWVELPQHIRDKWAAAASAIRHEVCSP